MRWVTLAWTLGLLSACSSGGSSPKAKAGDGGVAGEGAAGGGANKTGATFGARCSKSSDCKSGLSCDIEVDTSFSADNLPNGEKLVPSSVYPGGSCTPIASGPFDPTGHHSCDPTKPQAAQGCGANGACIVVSIGSRDEVACRPTCDPSAATNPCGHFYTCDFEQHACVEGCQSDEACRLTPVDTDGDGQSDVLRYDDTSKATCDTNTFRCVVKTSSPNASTGTPCARLDDCEKDGLCLQALQTYGGLPFPGGYCTKVGCDLNGRECTGDSAVCTPLRSWSPGMVTSSACFQTCAVGAEPASDQLGSKGHGKGCREGYRCHYNGTAGSADQGVCVGGNYNDVVDDNIGAPCKQDSDCYSPFGIGSCLTLSVAGTRAPSVCSLMDCAVPGLPDGVCGSSAECIGLSGDITFCAKTCKDATDCAAGFACADDDGDPSSAKICYPVCFGDADCRPGKETCKLSSSSSGGSSASPPVGTCVAS